MRLVAKLILVILVIVVIGAELSLDGGALVTFFATLEVVAVEVGSTAFAAARARVIRLGGD